MLGGLPSMSLLDGPSLLGGSSLLKNMQMGMMPDMMMPQMSRGSPAEQPKSYEQNDYVAKVTLPLPKQ